MEPTPHDEGYDDLLDPEWEKPEQTSRLTVALAAALLVVLGFAGGVLTQRAITPNAPTTVTGRGRGRARRPPGVACAAPGHREGRKVGRKARGGDPQRLTGVRARPSANQALRLSTTSWPMARRVGLLADPTCGSRTALSRSISSWGTFGSSS